MENQIKVSYWFGKYGFVPVLFLLTSLLFSIVDSLFDIGVVSYLVVVLIFIPLFILCFKHLNRKYPLLLQPEEIVLSGERILRGKDVKKIELRFGNSLFIYMNHKNILKKIVHLQISVSDSEKLNQLLVEWSKHNNKSYKRFI